MKPRKINWFKIGCGLLLAVQAIWSNLLYADSFGGELIVLTTHVMTQRDAPVELYERKLDDEGQQVLTPGLEIYWDHTLASPVWKVKELRITAGCLSDSIKHRFGYLAVLSRWVFYQRQSFQASLLIGPGLIFRETWRTVPGYQPDNPLDESDEFLPGYEYKFMPLGEIDLLYDITQQLQGVWSIVPGIPLVIVQSIGLRWTY